MKSHLLGLLLVAWLPLQGLCETMPLFVTTNPAVPLANEPLEISVTGYIDRYDFGDPTVEVSGGIIKVSLHRVCILSFSTTCDPPTQQTMTVRTAPLPPGNYTIIVYQFVETGGLIEGILSFAIAPAAPDVYRGLWWASPAGSQSGWGISIEHQGDALVMVWFTYDPNSPAGQDGLHSSTWFVMPNATRTGTATFSGDFYRTTGAAHPMWPFLMKASVAGHATLSFGDGDNAAFIYTLEDYPAGGLRTTGSTPITRQVFSAPMPRCTPGT